MGWCPPKYSIHPALLLSGCPKTQEGEGNGVNIKLSGDQILGPSGYGPALGAPCAGGFYVSHIPSLIMGRVVEGLLRVAGLSLGPK